MRTGSPALFPPPRRFPLQHPPTSTHHQAPSCYSTTSSALRLSFPWQPLAVLYCQLTLSLHTAAASSSVILLLLLSHIACHAAARLHFSFYTCITSGQPSILCCCSCDVLSLWFIYPSCSAPSTIPSDLFFLFNQRDGSSLKLKSIQKYFFVYQHSTYTYCI